MAWTIEQEQKLSELIRERSLIEGDANNLKIWNLTESYVQTITKNITDDEKQKILDSLVAARRPVLEKALIDKQAELDAVNAAITKEDTLVTKP
jgi:hypothetical protein